MMSRIGLDPLEDLLDRRPRAFKNLQERTIVEGQYAGNVHGGVIALSLPQKLSKRSTIEVIGRSRYVDNSKQSIRHVERPFLDFGLRSMCGGQEKIKYNDYPIG
jgi:hypothetical protein